MKSKAITLDQKMMASREYGVHLSTKTTERRAISILKSASTFTNETVWDNKLSKR
jgi:hypothetical protein